ncbi:MAG: hypothetical protein ACRDC6_16370 [Shewanella sp.]
MTSDYLKEWIKQAHENEKVKQLLSMPDWEFCIVFCNGMSEPTAGCVHKGVQYSEWDINAAYRCKWPDADPLF